MTKKNLPEKSDLNQEEDSKSSSTTLGGGDKPVIQVANQKVDVPPPEPETSGEEGGDDEMEQHPESAAVNKALVEVTAKTIGKLLAIMTKIEEMDFTDDEVEQLSNLWAQFVPPMSPMTTAMIGTGVILTGKLTIYMALKKKGVSRNAEAAAKEQSGGLPVSLDVPAPVIKT
jgi:hypothetical protein